MAATEKPHKKVSPSTSSENVVTTAIDDTQWQKEMLKRLQNSAAPEPIKVACTVTPAGKPDYLGEEYHGTVTKEEEKQILEGKNGRFIVRDCQSKSGPDEYTLAFNFDNSIQHIKLLYNTSTREFSTDSKKKEFKTVLEVISDVLRLLSEIQKRESLTLSKKGHCNKHTFKKYSYKHPKWCDVCGNFLWGLVNQGEKCEVCGINTHKACKETAPLPCSNVSSGRKVSIQKEEEKTSTKSIKQDSNYIYFSPQISTFDKCAYFRKCSRFLSAFNIRDSYVDMSNNMTRCFCNDCIKRTSVNFNGGAVSSENLKQWSRFQFEPQPDPLKRNIGRWEVVYFAANPKFVRNLIKGFFNPSNDGNDDEEIVVAPSLAYTTQDMQNENWSYKFSNTETGGELFAQTVLEVYLRPESFEVLPVTEIGVASKDYNDPVILPEHWKAKSKKDLYPKSILVKIFEK